MEWERLLDGRSYLPQGTVLRFPYQGNCYKILDKPIGYGGAGILYPAVHVTWREGRWIEDGMWVALKECYPCCTDGMLVRQNTGEIECAVLHDDYAAEYYNDAKAMMRREKEITGKVFNRGFRLTPLWDLVEQEEISLDGEIFYPVHNQYGIMERLDEKGQSLAGILKKQRGGYLTAYQSVCILRQILQAIAEVHGAGYLHGDIQENNIFVKGTDFSQNEDGIVTLIDFGSARKLLPDGKTSVIADKKLYTAFGYCAPECANCNDGTLRLTKAADIYSVGYLMLRMLLGKPMDTKALQLIVNGKYLYPRQAKKIGCTSASVDIVNRILDKALREHPEERYQTAEEMLEDLKRLERALMPKKSSIASVDYEAFISYCHDETSIQAAEKIQKMIERYKIPRSVQKFSGKKKMGKVFRDRVELPSSSDIEVHLKEALEHSEYLIVLLSPGVPGSVWVNREIELFLQTHDRDHILMILVDGDLAESFPEYLRKAEKFEQGQMKMTSVESLAADIRGMNPRQRKKKLRTEIFRLLAPMLGCGYDDLRQRQKEYRMRRTLQISLTAMCVFGAIAIYIGWQAVQIRRTYWEALTKQSRYLASVSEEILKSGDRKKALQVAMEALPDKESDQTKPRTAEAEAALVNALYAYQGEGNVSYSMRADQQMTMETASMGQEHLSEDGKYLIALDGNCTVYLWETETGNLLKRWDSKFWKQKNMDPDIIYCDFERADCVLFVTEDSVVKMSVSEEEILTEYKFQQDSITRCTLTSDKAYVVVFCDGIWGCCMQVYSILDGSMVCEINLEDTISEKMQYGYLTDLQIDEKGHYAAATFRTYFTDVDENEYTQGMMAVADLTSGSFYTVEDVEVNFFNCCFTENGKVVVLGYKPTDFLTPYDMECPGKIKCYDLKDFELSWERELFCQMGNNGKSGMEEDKESNVLAVWCDRQIQMLDIDTGELLRNPKSDAYVTNVCCRGKNRYLVGMQDGSLYILGGENVFVKIGTNVEKETDKILFHEDTFAAYLISEKNGSIVRMREQEDERKKTLRLEDEIYGVTTYLDVHNYIVNSYVDNEHSRTRAAIYNSETDEKVVAIEAKGIISADLWIEEGLYCYVQYIKNEESGYTTNITVYDVENAKIQWQTDVETSWTDIELLKTDTEKIAVCKEDDRVTFLDLTTGKWMEEESISIEKQEIEDGYVRDIPYLSYDGHYLMLLKAYHKYGQDSESDHLKTYVYDRRKKEWKESESLQDIEIGTSSPKVWMGKASSKVAVYDEGNRELIIFDMEKDEILQRIPFQGQDVWKVTFLRQDTQLLLWSDSTYLRLWDMEDDRLLMEDTKRLYRVSSIYVSEENGRIMIRGYDEEDLELYMGDKWMSQIYLLEGERFYPYVKVLNGFFEDTQNRIGSIGESQQVLYWFEQHDLDELLESAKEIVGEDVLTKSDEMKYFIAAD